MSSRPNLAYFWGEDAFAIEQAARAFAGEAGEPGQPLEAWRASADEDASEGDGVSTAAGRRRSRLLDEMEQRLATAPLFGGGTLVVVGQPAGLIRETAARERLVAMVGAVPPGNALCFTDLLGSDARAPASAGVLRDAVAAAGGIVRQFLVPTRERMEAWLAARAKELDLTLGPGAARLIAERIGSHVRESDIDRRRQTELANSELEKLALYRPGGTVTTTDVTELVAEAVPGSTWAFLDALGARRGADAALLAERLTVSGTPLPVLVSQAHRRVRELLLIREHLDAGTRPADIARQMRLQPYRAEKLTEQARAWTIAGLEAALGDLLDLDLRSKGISLDGSTVQMGDARDALGLQVWLALHTARGAATGHATGS